VKLDLVKARSGRRSSRVVLFAIGVVANLEGVLSPKVNLKARPRLRGRSTKLSLERPRIYAAGDIIGPPWLGTCDLRGGQPRSTECSAAARRSA